MSIFADPSVVINSKYNTDTRGFVFPTDLLNIAADRNFYISIKFYRYERRSIFDRMFQRDNGGICLPLPARLVESTGVSWEVTKTDPMVGAGIETYLRKDSTGTDVAKAVGAGALMQAAGSAGSIVGGALGGLAAGLPTRGRGTAAGIALGQALGGKLDQALPQVLQINGVAQNPFMTVLFKQPEYKTHQFSWQLAPRNPQESEIVRDIINCLKSNMLPAFTPGTMGVLLTYPNIARINLYPSDTFLYQFKPCALTKFSVNYAGAGNQPSFFKGTKAPTVVEIATEWQEIEYWMKEDIEGGDWRDAAMSFGTKSISGGGAAP